VSPTDILLLGLQRPDPEVALRTTPSGSEAGSYLRLIDFVYHSTLGSRVMKKKIRRW